MKQSKIILASSSPRRKELFEKYHLNYSVDFVDTDEVLDENLTLFKRLENIAIQKAKPKDRSDAKRMLQMLSGHKQTVITGVCVIKDQHIASFSDATDILFKKLSEEEIENYLDTNEWEGKAGAYAIQGKASQFVEINDGDLENVIGLPMYKLLNYL